MFEAVEQVCAAAAVSKIHYANLAVDRHAYEQWKVQADVLYVARALRCVNLESLLPNSKLPADGSLPCAGLEVQSCLHVERWVTIQPRGYSTQKRRIPGQESLHCGSESGSPAIEDVSTEYMVQKRERRTWDGDCRETSLSCCSVLSTEVCFWKFCRAFDGPHRASLMIADRYDVPVYTIR
jgi:hypothetical protein